MAPSLLNASADFSTYPATRRAHEWSHNATSSWIGDRDVCLLFAEWRARCRAHWRADRAGQFRSARPACCIYRRSSASHCCSRRASDYLLPRVSRDKRIRLGRSRRCAVLTVGFLRFGDHLRFRAPGVPDRGRAKASDGAGFRRCVRARDVGSTDRNSKTCDCRERAHHQTRIL